MFRTVDVTAQFKVLKLKKRRGVNKCVQQLADITESQRENFRMVTQQELCDFRLMSTYVVGLRPHSTQTKGTLNWFKCDSGHRMDHAVSWH